MTTKTNLRWFRAGAEAVAKTLDNGLGHDVFVCPICARPIHISHVKSEIRVEHSPQKNLSKISGLPGRKIALTCVDCNEGAGRNLESQLKNSEDRLDAVAQGKDRVAISVGGVRTIADFHVDETGKIVLTNLENRNSPEQMEASARAFKEAFEHGQTFTIHTELGPNWPAEIAWLKSAYIAAFATFGYAYCLNQQLNIIREQITNPSQRLVRYFRFEQPEAPRNRLGIRLVHEPSDGACVQVFMGRHIVFLPSPWAKIDLYDYLNKLASTGSTYPRASRHTDFEWPKSPQHICDDGQVRYKGSIGERDNEPELWKRNTKPNIR